MIKYYEVKKIFLHIRFFANSLQIQKGCSGNEMGKVMLAFMTFHLAVRSGATGISKELQAS